jgi:hypothetical protein
MALRVSSGLNYKRMDGSLQEVIIPNGQQCSGSNVGQVGVWVSDVTSRSKLKHCSFILFSQIIDSKIVQLLFTRFSDRFLQFIE